MKEAFENADVVYPKSWAPFAFMERRTNLYGEGKFKEIDVLEKELLEENAKHKDWECTEEMMKLTKDEKHYIYTVYQRILLELVARKER